MYSSPNLRQRYSQSEELLERALRTIPLGSQTFSKSKTQYPKGVSPYFIRKGKGSQVWDVDGNQYTDFVNSLAAINLGYRDPDVDGAVRSQLEEGSIFTLPHPLECEVAEKIGEVVPCAEMVRFGKNGSDATAGAIRLARAYTGRDRVAVCGYHGWQDWYIGSTARNRGVPKAVRELTHTFKYNDIDSLTALFKEYPDSIAAVILEPMNAAEPRDEFLSKAKELTHRHGALYIFDETVTGFRYARGGAQELFKVTPDLATFGKGLANGYPISAITGRADVMRLMEEIFFSFTFGGETLSLAAALATVTKVQKEPVIEHLASQGTKIIEGVRQRVHKHGVESILSMSGHPSWSFLNFKDHENCSAFALKTLYLQEIFRRGVICLGTHNISYAHSNEDISKLLETYDEVFPLLRQAISSSGALEGMLQCQVLEPLYKVR